MTAMHFQSHTPQSRSWSRQTLVPVALGAAAVIGLLIGGPRSPWVSLMYAPLVLMAFRSWRHAVQAAALASVLYIGVLVAREPATLETARDAGVQVLMFFGVTLLVGGMAHRLAARQASRDAEAEAVRTSLDVQHMINAAYDTDVTLDLVILKQREIWPAQSFAVLLTDNKVLRVRVSSSLPAESRNVRLGVHDDDHGWSPSDGRPLVIADTTITETRLSELDPEARSILVVPLNSVERMVGLLFFGSPERDAFPQEAIDRAEEFANRIVFPVQRALLEEDLRRLAFTDAQTSLFNHRHFQTLLDEEIRRAQRYGRSLALLFLDIDEFKAYNDAHGHPAGDALLSEISRVLRMNLRNVDMAARYGGEEFVAILPETTGEQALVLAERLRHAVESMEAHPAGPLRRPVTVSIGVASFPADAQSKSDLIEAADRATYEAKRAGRNRVRSAGGSGGDAGARPASERGAPSDC